MNITTKFDIGEKVYLKSDIHSPIPWEKGIGKIIVTRNIFEGEEEIDVRYELYGQGTETGNPHRESELIRPKKFEETRQAMEELIERELHED